MRSPFFHLALAAIVFAVPSHALAQSKTQRPTISLFQSNDRVLVMLTIGDNPPLPAVFDTGTNGNVIDMGVAEKLGLENRGGSRSIDGSTGKPVPGFETFIADASLGGTPIQDARATAMAFNHPNEVAIIGPNSFPGQYVMMDLAKSRLTLFAPDEAPKAGEGFPYLGHDGAALPSLDIQVEGRAIAAILDTGNNSDFLLPLSMADDLPLEAAPVVIGRAVSAAGAQDVYEARLDGDVSVAGLTIPHPRIRFIAGGRPNIGMPVLRQLKLMFDPVARRTWVVAKEPSAR
ncbi:pepsin/retropepsin-like aspartic protease family protein [Brevundimonas diminuta]|uniref:pepsin/retropepsin-like aspartic protease family protein n=1 Tax=Brevundimonas diminuta TaxID=293 RepID=UPI000B34EB01|nr:pepsin/retropepsin-like aspartic protease family protein [Brevundimonas diminuta]